MFYGWNDSKKTSERPTEKTAKNDLKMIQTRFKNDSQRKKWPKKRPKNVFRRAKAKQAKKSQKHSQFQDFFSIF